MIDYIVNECANDDVTISFVCAWEFKLFHLTFPRTPKTPSCQKSRFIQSDCVFFFSLENYWGNANHDFVLCLIHHYFTSPLHFLSEHR